MEAILYFLLLVGVFIFSLPFLVIKFLQRVTNSGRKKFQHRCYRQQLLIIFKPCRKKSLVQALTRALPRRHCIITQNQEHCLLHCCCWPFLICHPCHITKLIRLIMSKVLNPGKRCILKFMSRMGKALTKVSRQLFAASLYSLFTVKSKSAPPDSVLLDKYTILTFIRHCVSCIRVNWAPVL